MATTRKEIERTWQRSQGATSKCTIIKYIPHLHKIVSGKKALRSRRGEEEGRGEASELQREGRYSL